MAFLGSLLGALGGGGGAGSLGPLGLDFSLHANAGSGEHVYTLPGSPECEEAANLAGACSRVLRVCSLASGGECEVQCLARTPPLLSSDCRASHPCAADVEALCADPRHAGGVLHCLHLVRERVSPACRAAEPCLRFPSWNTAACEGGLPHALTSTSPWRHRPRFHLSGLAAGLPHAMRADGGGVHHAHFSHSLTDGPCACLDECGDHLHEPICEPCDPLAAPPAHAGVTSVHAHGHPLGMGGSGARRRAPPPRSHPPPLARCPWTPLAPCCRWWRRRWLDSSSTAIGWSARTRSGQPCTTWRPSRATTWSSACAS